MFFVLSRVFGIVTVPSNFFVNAGLTGIALLRTRYAASARRLVVASILLIAAIGFLPIGDMLARPLEGRFPATSVLAPPTGIVVLGGVILPAITAARGQVSLNDAAERLTAAAELARQFPNARIVFSGGNGDLIGGRPEGDFVIRFFESLSVARGRITVENQSRNTAENALYSKRIIDPKAGERWLLITSAVHMPRAVGAFRQAGFSVEPYPVDYLTTGQRHLWQLSGSAVGGIRVTDTAAHEWLGLFSYWITNRIPVIFPGPATIKIK
jgi:uncharacterized SAM-binding protein YcdF (DUF218 family)